MDYTHILSIKVWSNTYRDTTNYSNINTKIKELLLENNFTETVKLDGNSHTIAIKWETPVWDEKMKQLIIGDFISNINYSHTYDIVIFKHTEIVFNKIEEKLKKDKMLSINDTIIFNIVKSLSKVKPFVDNYNR